MKRNLTIFCFGFLALCNAREGFCEAYVSDEVLLDAFGGFINIPDYMNIAVGESKGDSYEIRIVKKVDAEGGLTAIIIKRPSEPYKSIGDNVMLVEKYIVNGFSVDLYKPKNPENGYNMLAAEVTRCGETGHILVKKRLQLDQYLAQAPPVICD